MFHGSPTTSGKKRKLRTMDINSPGMKTLGRQSKRHIPDRDKEWREKSASFGKKRSSMLGLGDENNMNLNLNNSPSSANKRHSLNTYRIVGLNENTFDNSGEDSLSLPSAIPSLENAFSSSLPPKLNVASPMNSPLPVPLSPAQTPTTPSPLPAPISHLPAPLSSPATTPLPPPIFKSSSVPASPLPAPLSLGGSNVPPSPCKLPAAQLRLGGMGSPASPSASPSANYLRKRRGSAPAFPTSMMAAGPLFPVTSSSSGYVTPKPKLPPLPSLALAPTAGTAEGSPGEAKRLRKLGQAKNELLQTEKTYHEILHSLVFEFLVPLKELVPTTHLDKLFGNVVELYNISTVFLCHFEHWVNGETPLLCQVFDEKWTDLLNAMIAYCDRFGFLQQQNFKLIVEGVDPSSPNTPVDHAYKKTSVAITAFLKSKKVAPVDLNSKLVVPCQRVMRYKMLVEEIKKHSNPLDQEAYRDLQKVGKMAQTIADGVNEYMSKLAKKHKCHQITEEFAARFENGDEFVVTMENDLAAIQAEADVVILEPNTAFDFDNDSHSSDSSISFQYPTRQATGKSSRPVYLLKSGVSSKCVLEETKERVALLGSKLVRATGGKKSMMIEEIVSLDYGFYIRGEADNHLHILTPYSDFVLQFGSERDLLGWVAELDKVFDQLEEQVKRKRKRHAKRIAFYRFGGCLVGAKAVNRPFMLIWLDMDDSDVPYPSDCGLKNVQKRVRRGEGGDKRDSGEGEEDLGEEERPDDNEVEVVRYPVRKMSASMLPSHPSAPHMQKKEGETAGESCEDPSVLAMYAQLHQLEEQHKKNPLPNYKTAITLSRVAIINRKKMLIEFDNTSISFTEEEREWELDMVMEEDGGVGGGVGGTPKFKRFLPKCNMPKASPSLKRVRKGW